MDNATTSQNTANRWAQRKKSPSSDLNFFSSPFAPIDSFHVTHSQGVHWEFISCDVCVGSAVRTGGLMLHFRITKLESYHEKTFSTVMDDTRGNTTLAMPCDVRVLRDFNYQTRKLRVTNKICVLNGTFSARQWQICAETCLLIEVNWSGINNSSHVAFMFAQMPTDELRKLGSCQTECFYLLVRIDRDDNREEVARIPQPFARKKSHSTASFYCLQSECSSSKSAERMLV